LTHALLEVLEATHAAGMDDRVRTAAQAMYQALIDAELTAVIGATLSPPPALLS
jgi:putative transposase